MIRIFQLLLLLAFALSAKAQVELPIGIVDGQPLGANALRLIQAMEFLGAPLSRSLVQELKSAVSSRDGEEIQKILDPQVLVSVTLNPEVRVKAARGPAKALLRQAGYTPYIVKVFNDSTVARPLRVTSPQSGPVYSGASLGILKRQAQTELNENENLKGDRGRFISIEMFNSPPMASSLSGLEVEYAIVLINSQEAGKREATLQFDVGQGTQDLGFRAQVPVLFEVLPAIEVKLDIRDSDNLPTTARLEFRDSSGRVYPHQAKRLAPDFFFQPHIYRADGQSVLLPPGKFAMEFSRGPEYIVHNKEIKVLDELDTEISVKLIRWVDPSEFGFYSGDHHIHGAGCSHYDSPTKGVSPADMFMQVKGEGLNVGCVLTWGPCFEFQRNYFSPDSDEVSEPMTLLKYDIEVSGFGSSALGHVCLLNLKKQTYPGSGGTKTKGWPTWTVPVLRWCKEQGGVTGYPHSALHVNPSATAKWLLKANDKDRNLELTAKEASKTLLPESFSKIDSDGSGSLNETELAGSADRVADQLPNYAIPALDGGGAMEIFVSTAEGVCDFISAMDTARIPEWNTWYHLLNCGFPLKLSGETDFPCMSSRRVGAGRVYVQMGEQTKIEFTEWCRGLAEGRSYVSDGYAHALKFAVNGESPGFREVKLSKAGKVSVQAKVSFSPETPVTVAQGLVKAPSGLRTSGDTVNLHAPRHRKFIKGGERLVEVVVNGQVVAKEIIPADGQVHDLEFKINISRSSWIALRHFPQLHTNPVNVIVDGKPIRASKESALWCKESVKLLWENRSRFITESERDEAKIAYDRAVKTYNRIAKDSPSKR
ncbi:MAG: CehA/McbA family metallohydrolase [Verrucomicrobiota bacterium]|nr:CehA/McbA family metallohydrolase [Verrucomicrobiota bacterium]